MVKLDSCVVFLASGSVGINIPRMLALFKNGHEYMVEDIHVNTQVATVSHIELLWVTDISIYIYIYNKVSVSNCDICLFSYLCGVVGNTLQ